MVRLLAGTWRDGKAFIVSDYVDEFGRTQITQTPKGRVTYGAPAGSRDDVVSAKMLQHWGIVMENTRESHVMNGVDVDDIVTDFGATGDEPENVDPDYFMDYDDDVEVDTGAPVVRAISCTFGAGPDEQPAGLGAGADAASATRVAPARGGPPEHQLGAGISTADSRHDPRRRRGVAGVARP